MEVRGEEATTTNCGLVCTFGNPMDVASEHWAVSVSDH